MSVVVGLAAVLGLSGCGSSGNNAAADASGVTTLRYQGWPDEVLLPELAENLGFFDGKIKLDWVGSTTSGPQDIQSAATGQTDYGAAFSGAIAKLVTAGAPITAVVDWYGADQQSFRGFYVTDGSPITKPADLLGKKIGVNTLGGQEEADIHDEFKKLGFTESQIKTIQLVTLPPANTADALRKGQLDAAALEGQFQLRALAQGGLRPVFTELDEYGPFAGGQYVFRNDVINRNPTAIRIFVTGVAKALQWEHDTPRAEVIAKFTEIVNARHRPNESTDTLKYWLSSSEPVPYGVIDAQDFARWQSWLQDTGAISGPLDTSKLYTNKFNPYAAQAASQAGR